MRRLLAGAAALSLLAVPATGVAQVASPGPCERPDERLPGVPTNVELVTVTDRSFTATWLTCDEQGGPAPSDTTVTYAKLTDPLALTTLTVERDVAFHHAVIEGLEPGTTYLYEVFSEGLPGRYDRYHPGMFTTLAPPPGKPLFTFAILADTHIGEHTSGLATSQPFPFPPGYSGEDYAEVMASAAVEEINEEHVTFTMLPADSSSHGERHDLETAREIFEELERPYVIARGTHDRPNQYADAREECAPDGDCFREVFFPTRSGTDEPRPIYYARFKPRYALIALDSVNLQTAAGELSNTQLSWLDEKLSVADERGVPAFVFFHHPVSEWSTTLAIPPLVFGVNQHDAQRFLQIVGDHESVRAIVNAHTHRNWISYSPWTGRVPILEVGPSKEYPGGYSIVKVYRDGFTRTFHRLSCGFCRRWTETTRWQYLGQYPHYTTGSLRDRNFVHRWDRPDVPAGPPSLPFNPWAPALPMEA